MATRLRAFLPLILITALGLALRLYQLDKVPPSLNWDEVSHGWNAYSILKTGRDEWGQSFPIANFRAYGDYPLPLNLYLTIPFVWKLGLSAFSIRLPHVLLGTLTPIAIYFLAYNLTKKKYVGLLASFLAAVGPWYVFTSREVLQSNLSVFLLTSAMALFFARSKNRYFLPLSFLLLGLTLFSYHSTRVFSPLLLVAILWIYKKELAGLFTKERATAVLSLVVVTVFFIPLPYILFSPEARARSNWIFILDSGAVGKIEEERQASKLGPTITRLVYNRPLYLVEEATWRYVEYFSPQFLFYKGGTQYQFSVPGRGLLYLVNSPFFYLGLVVLVKRAWKGDRDYKLLLTWLLLAPIPASVTQDHYAIVRATTMLPLPEILTAFGVFEFWIWVRGAFAGTKLRTVLPIFIASYIVFLSANVEVYLMDLFTQYSAHYSQAWQYGYKNIMDYVKANYNQYDKIIITKKYGEPHEFLLFYWPWDPKKYREDPNLVRFNQSNWYWVDSFDKFYFVNDWEVPNTENGRWKLESGGEIPMSARALLITSPENYPKTGWKLLKTIRFLDGTHAFDIVEKI